MKVKSYQDLLTQITEDPGQVDVITVSIPHHVKSFFLGPELEPARSKGARLTKLVKCYLAQKVKEQGAAAL
jgi:hypothetical protein